MIKNVKSFVLFKFRLSTENVHKSLENCQQIIDINKNFVTQIPKLFLLCLHFDKIVLHILHGKLIVINGNHKYSKLQNLMSVENVHEINIM